MEFLILLLFGFVWDMLITGLVVLIFNAIGIPFLAALTFWQVFALLIVIGLATMKLSTD